MHLPRACVVAEVLQSTRGSSTGEEKESAMVQAEGLESRAANDEELYLTVK